MGAAQAHTNPPTRKHLLKSNGICRFPAFRSLLDPQLITPRIRVLVWACLHITLTQSAINRGSKALRSAINYANVIGAPSSAQHQPVPRPHTWSNRIRAVTSSSRVCGPRALRHRVERGDVGFATENRTGPSSRWDALRPATPCIVSNCGVQ